MYIPEYFKNENLTVVKDFINANGFAILISQVDGRPWVTHIPLMLDKNVKGKDILTGHISKANKQWKEFDKNKEVLAIFSGPHAYISSSWYDHENVPTWNYLAVHVYGKIHIIERDILKKQLSKLVDKYESGMDKPVSVDRMSKEFVEKEMRGIVGFEIEITDIQAALKLSQNKDDKNYERIINGLDQKGDMNSLEIARIMKNRK
ncbi:MAG: FMN-binding negative transcriptional regulator [Cytophagales bacterium]|nr:FMN-binding negative transcriptional regulator [Cytophagales bacterium]